MKYRIMMNKSGLESIASGQVPKYHFDISPECDWDIMVDFYAKQGGTCVAELEFNLPTREAAVAAILPFLDGEKAAIMQKAFEECQKVEVRRQNVLALEAPKTPEELRPTGRDDIPF